MMGRNVFKNIFAMVPPHEPKQNLQNPYTFAA